MGPYYANGFSYGMMPRLILILIKQAPDNLLIIIQILEKFCIEYKFEGSIFYCVRFCRRKNVRLFATYPIRDVFVSTSYFLSEKDPGIVKFCCV